MRFCCPLQHVGNHRVVSSLRASLAYTRTENSAEVWPSSCATVVGASCAKTADRVYIAYQVVGSGPVDVAMDFHASQATST